MPGVLESAALGKQRAVATGSVRSRILRRRRRGAHDLNPVELVWGNIKAVEPANLCADTIGQARGAAEAGLKRVSASPGLCFAFLAHTGLSL
jgi:hypothetical protein